METLENLSFPSHQGPLEIAFPLEFTSPALLPFVPTSHCSSFGQCSLCCHESTYQRILPHALHFSPNSALPQTRKQLHRVSPLSSPGARCPLLLWVYQIAFSKTLEFLRSHHVLWNFSSNIRLCVFILSYSYLPRIRILHKA